MAGLLGQNRSAGLLSATPGNRGATPDALRRAREEEARRAALSAPAQAPQRERVSGWRVFDRVLGGKTITDAIDAERARPAEEAMRQARLGAQQGLTEMFAGQPAPGVGVGTGAGALPGQSAPRGLPSLTDAAPALIRAQLAGIEGVGGIRETLEALQPDIAIGPDGRPYNRRDPAALEGRFANRTNINGYVTDLNNPANEGRYFPDLEPGQTPLYDREGNVVAVRNLDGAVQAVGERERAVNDARNASEASYARTIAGERSAGSAPYEFVNVPTPSGAPAVISRQAAAGGVFQGQAPADAVLAEGTARNEVAAAEEARSRASAAVRMLPTLATMESLLPDVISGFGADQRLAANRALAATGHADARRRATATQTFQNEARQVVAGILPMFGTNPTEGERKYAEQMSGADVNYTPESLAEGIRLARARAARELRAYEARGGEIRLTPEQARMLPSGTQFTGEDGVRRTVR